jgi:RecB family endonuclease NucS
MRQVAGKRTRKINGQIGAARRQELEWLRIDLLKVWAAARFDVDAYARIRYQIRLLIDAAREAGEQQSRAVLSLRRRRKWRQQRRGALLMPPSIAAARMELMQGLD